MKDRMPMLGLVLLATLPVIAGVALAGLIGLRHGALPLWCAIVAAACAAIAIWGLQAPEGTPAMQRFGAAVSVYGPALLIGGGILALQELPSLTLGRISRGIPGRGRERLLGSAVLRLGLRGQLLGLPLR